MPLTLALVLALVPLQTVGPHAGEHLPDGTPSATDPGAGDASVTPGATGPVSGLAFRDGDRPRIVERTGSTDEDGWYPVRVHELDTGLVVDGSVGPQTIVALRPGADPASTWQRLGLAEEVEPLIEDRGIWVVVAPSGDGAELAAQLTARDDPALWFAAPDIAFPVKLHDINIPPNDERYSGQWYLDKIDIEAAWALSVGGPAVEILVVDNGCDLEHPDLVDHMGPGRDFVDGDEDPSYAPSEPCEIDEDCCPDGPVLGACCGEGGYCLDGNAHGTSCAGIVAATTDNGLGIAGTCPECTVRCARLLGAPLPASTIASVFTYARDQGVHVVSNSWGYQQEQSVPETVAIAIDSAYRSGRGGLGAVIVFAMGNDSREVKSYELMAVEGVVGVGALNQFDELSNFSNIGDPVDLTSPAGTLTLDISGPQGDTPDDVTPLFGGTSSACPVVAGVAGLMFGPNINVSAQEISDILIHTARPAPFAMPDEDGHDTEYGFGVVDPRRAIAVISGLEPLEPDPVPDGGPAGDGGEDPEPDPGDLDDVGDCGCQGSVGSAPLVAWGALLFAARRRRRCV